MKEIDQRSHLLATTSRVDESSDRLLNAHRIAIETEDIGTNVLGELYTQKKTLERARDNVSTTITITITKAPFYNSLTGYIQDE